MRLGMCRHWCRYTRLILGVFALMFAAGGCSSKKNFKDPSKSPQPDSSGDQAPALPGSPDQKGNLTAAANDLLKAINAERTAAGLPNLERRSSLDAVMLYYANIMAIDKHIGHIDRKGREVNGRVKFFSGKSDIRCSEITQWWGGSASGSVHYNGYKNSPSHRKAYREEGAFNLGPTSHAGVAVVSGTGPADSQFAGRSGSYSGVMFCDQDFELAESPTE